MSVVPIRVLHEVGNEFGDALLARIHARYIERFTADALAAGVRPGSLEFVDEVATRLGEVGFSEAELRQFCASHGWDDLDPRYFEAITRRPPWPAPPN